MASSKRRSRKGWTGGVARSWAELQAVDDEWWLALTPAERIELTAELSCSYDWSELREEEECSIRWLGALGGVRTRPR